MVYEVPKLAFSYVDGGFTAEAPPLPGSHSRLGSFDFAILDNLLSFLMTYSAGVENYGMTGVENNEGDEEDDGTETQCGQLESGRRGREILLEERGGCKRITANNEWQYLRSRGFL